jgi:hypothetical protein
MEEADAPRDEDHARIGRVVAGKYKLVRLLGAGGMGAVYEAENTWTHRRVAVKVLRASLARDVETVSRFLQEARAASSVRHPNIVDVLDMGREETDQGALYIVQALLEGVDLRSRMRAVGRVAPEEVVATMGPILEALAVAHAAGIVHRDVKPENIFLADRAHGAPVPTLIDFGISKVLRPDASEVSPHTREGTPMGTLAYMSPEQARGDVTLDGRTDVWSVGVVMYEMLCGRCPFDGATYGVRIVQIITQDAPRIESFAPAVPRALADAVHRALRRDRALRYADAAAFRRALLASAAPARSLRTVGLAALASLVAAGVGAALARRPAPAPRAVAAPRDASEAPPAPASSAADAATDREPSRDAAAPEPAVSPPRRAPVSHALSERSAREAAARIARRGDGAVREAAPVTPGDELEPITVYPDAGGGRPSP